MRTPTFVLLAALLCISAGSALAAPDENRWRVELQPYAWLAARITGDLTVDTPPAAVARGVAPVLTVPVNLSLDELFSKLQLAAMLRAEAWRGRWGLIYDGTYLQTEAGATAGTLDVDVTSRLMVHDVLLGLVVLRWPAGAASEAPRLSVELDGGARMTWLQLDVDVGQASASRDRLRAKGLIGARVPLRLSKSWVVGARTVVALPGPSWQLVGGAQWDATELFALKLGYRVDGWNTGGASTSLDVLAHGPYLGFGFRFGGPIF